MLTGLSKPLGQTSENQGSLSQNDLTRPRKRKAKITAPDGEP
ncbi:hypothetical protein HNQ92_001028 [Rhabdobacter roseus]|uniref:Uncharacterized protein n=1 Tax=Rhabdobacter roseus TaxID=1655419 RepID=A0A840TMY4_9BACT|nr:hypothetical protein [Rhabdobacter roseus]